MAFNIKDDTGGVVEIRDSYDYSLYSKSLGYLDMNLYRNVSNVSGSFNGFGLPAGELCNPYYHTESRTAAFMMDDNKRYSVDYFDYISTVYGTSKAFIKLHSVISDMPGQEHVGMVDTYRITGSTVNSNPNGVSNDTLLGKNSAENAFNTLSRSVSYYTIQKDYNELYHTHQPITLNMDDNFGMNTEALLGNAIAGISTRLDPSTGRYAMLMPTFAADVTEIQPWGDLSNNGYKKLYDMSSYDAVQKYLDYMVGQNKYRVLYSNGGESFNYFESVGVTPTSSGGKRYGWKGSVRTSNLTAGNILFTYGEAEDGVSHNVNPYTFNRGIRFGMVSTYGDLSDDVNDMVYKTNKGFKDGEYKTLIGRFHTSKTEVSDNDTKQTAVSKNFGMSHGRNLLIKNPSSNMTHSPGDDGYSNPYCRVWTYHHQYSRLRDTMRPFTKSSSGGVISQGDMYKTYNFAAFSSDGNGSMNGRERLDNYGVLNKNNGLVNITPINNTSADKKVDIKRCMFSIENLAWKDVDSGKGFHKQGLSEEQRGPFGGRIMWFPPYDLKFSESVSSQWNSHSFIGRGENIYTYTNTDRNGTLSFKIVIDHPSILDYWEGKGRDVSRVGDVDADDYENSLLRFFAGCEVLQASSPKRIPEKNVPKHEVIQKGQSTEKTIRFYVFYPNDFSGKDYSGVQAIDYLINGLGAKLCDATRKYRDTKIGPVGGYEMRDGVGISVVDTIPSEDVYRKVWDDKNDFLDIQKYYGYDDCENGKSTAKRFFDWCYLVDKEKHCEKLLIKSNYVDSDSKCYNSTKGLDDVAKAFQIKNDDTLFSLADVYAYFYNDDEKRRSVIDKLYSEAKVEKLASYLSGNAYKIKSINCYGMASSQYNVSDSVKEKRNLSLEIGRAETPKKWLETMLSRSNKSHGEITAQAYGEGKFVGKSGNVSAGDPKLRRCACVEINLASAQATDTQGNSREYDTKQVTSSQSSKARSISTYTKEWGAKYLNALKGIMSSKPSQTNTLLVGSVPRSITKNMTYVGNDFNNPYLDRASQHADMVQIVRGAANIFNYVKMSVKDVDFKDVNYTGIGEAALGYFGLYKNYSFDSNGYIRSNRSGNGNGAFVNPVEVSKTISSVFGDKESTSAETEAYESGTNLGRYDNEGDFFRALELNDPVLHSKITDKIKYFDPAFHAISPEGFNARLTFLQQCTRQGPTYAASDANANGSANNMSFGRPPVCILRIGDFYYTKIIIESLNIDYEQQWDLNPEGIGVMPMIANVTLNFKFIGGSSLSGPISRLQNALSFNSYANTEVYDNRAERAEYDEGGNLVSFQPYIASNN